MKTVLFVCVHNAGRSQMAEAFMNHIARERGLCITGMSAGTVGGKTLNPAAIEVMREIGIPMDEQAPKLLTAEMVKRADRVISMGCGVDADACPAKFILTEDWALDDPAGQPIERVRAIRDAVRSKVSGLLDDMERA